MFKAKLESMETTSKNTKTNKAAQKEEDGKALEEKWAAEVGKLKPVVQYLGVDFLFDPGCKTKGQLREKARGSLAKTLRRIRIATHSYGRRRRLLTANAIMWNVVQTWSKQNPTQCIA